MRRRTVLSWMGAAAFVLLGSLLLVVAEMGGVDWDLWLAYLVLLGVGCALLYLGWLCVRSEGASRLLLLLALLGLFVRLAAGLVLTKGLPEWGYDEKAQRAGYVYWDAYKRDQDSWARAQSDSPLTTAFTNPKASDQYGGLLFISAAIYRYLGGEQHHPFMVVILLASVSVLAVFFTWGFLRRLTGPRAAWIGAWIVALYPEAVLLSASQMREPFLISSLALALYGFMLLQGASTRKGWGLLLIAMLAVLPISPPMVLILLAVLGGAWLWEARGNRKLIAGVAILGLLAAGGALIVTARSWANLEGVSGSIWDVTRAWLVNAGSQWRVNLISSQSDLLDVLLDRLPGSLQVPFLVLFGLLQPFLPAALVAPGAPVWKVIGILRSLGWFASLPLLVYATLRVFRSAQRRSLMPYLVIVFWVAASVSSYRAPSYQWDNPRYRAIFLAIQAAIMAWAWVQARQERGPGLRDTFVLLLLPLVVVTAWYVARYSGAFSMGLEVTLGLSLLLDVLYVVALGVHKKWIKRREHVGKFPGPRV